MHKSGFVSVIGYPNAGKSTLINIILKTELLLTNEKPQTTRRKILGILNEKEYQIIFNDTPGIITDPKYLLHNKMNEQIESAIEETDCYLCLIDISSLEIPEKVIKIIEKEPKKVIIVLNKIDLKTEKELVVAFEVISKKLPNIEIIPISALKNILIEPLIKSILLKIPEHPPYFPKENDEISDKPDKFFASEFIRGAIYNRFQKEIPYSTEVSIEQFYEKNNILYIYANVMVERESQKAILLGNNGNAIRDFSTKARIKLEQFFKSKIFLDIKIKVEKDWRSSEKSLKKFDF